MLYLSPILNSVMFILGSNDTNNISMASLLLELLNTLTQSFNLPYFQWVAPNFLVKLMSLFDAMAKSSVPCLDKETFFDNSRMKRVLGITPIEIPTSLVDMAYSMIENGMVQKTAQYKGRPQ